MDSFCQLAFTCSKSTIETLEEGVKCSILTIKAPERHCSVVFIFTFEHISHHFLMFRIAKFAKLKQVNVSRFKQVDF